MTPAGALIWFKRDHKACLLIFSYLRFNPFLSGVHLVSRLAVASLLSNPTARWFHFEKMPERQVLVGRSDITRPGSHQPGNTAVTRTQINTNTDMQADFRQALNKESLSMCEDSGALGSGWELFLAGWRSSCVVGDLCGDLSSGSPSPPPLLSSCLVLTGRTMGISSRGHQRRSYVGKPHRVPQRSPRFNFHNSTDLIWGQRSFACLSSVIQTVLPGNYPHLSQLGVWLLKEPRTVCL